MTYRHELKFLVPEQELCLLENKVSQIFEKDSHVGAKGVYNIRSIYFDTFDNKYLEENIAGVDNRRKFRIRIYDLNENIIKLECKSTKHGLKKKEICNITKQQCEQLMAGNIMIPIMENQEVLRKLQYEYMINLLQPKVIVEYIRTPFVYEVGNVRITFDRKICSSHCVGGFWDRKLVKREILPEEINILEVKYDEVLPSTIKEMLNEGVCMNRTSFSKYAMCRVNSLR